MVGNLKKHIIYCAKLKYDSTKNTVWFLSKS